MFWVSFYDAQLCSLESYLLFVRFLLVTVHHHGKLAIHKSCIDLDCANHWVSVSRVRYPCLMVSLSVSAAVGGPELTEPEPERDLSPCSGGDSWPLAHRALTGLVTASHWSPGLTSGLWLVRSGSLPHRFCCRLSVSLGDSVVGTWPRVPRPVFASIPGVRGRILFYERNEEYTLIMRPRDLASIRHSGVRGRLTTQFMAPVSFAAPAPRNFGYLIIERRNIPSQVSKMIMNYPSLETGASNKQRNCLHFSVCIYSLGQTRNKCSNSIKVSRKCNRSPSLPSPQLRIDCLLHKNKNRFPANVSLRRKMAMAMIYGVLLWLPKSFLQESIFSFK